MKIKEISEAMSGNTVWCRNSWFAPSATPCAEVAGCTFKDREVRSATVSSSWKTAVHVYPKADHELDKQLDRGS
jgi:hypothetical protein